jgi:hypothetical protein
MKGEAGLCVSVVSDTVALLGVVKGRREGGKRGKEKERERDGTLEPILLHACIFPSLLAAWCPESPELLRPSPVSLSQKKNQHEICLPPQKKKTTVPSW